MSADVTYWACLSGFVYPISDLTEETLKSLEDGKTCASAWKCEDGVRTTTYENVDGKLVEV